MGKATGNRKNNKALKNKITSHKEQSWGEYFISLPKKLLGYEPNEISLDNAIGEKNAERAKVLYAEAHRSKKRLDEKYNPQLTPEESGDPSKKRFANAALGLASLTSPGDVNHNLRRTLALSPESNDISGEVRTRIVSGKDLSSFSNTISSALVERDTKNISLSNIKNSNKVKNRDKRNTAQIQEFLVNTQTENYQNGPHIASFPNHNFIIVWASENQDGSSAGVYAQSYDSNGDKQGNEFLVNTHTDSRQYSAFASSLSDGGFVIVWESVGQDGSSHGIYAQLFNRYRKKIGSEFRVNSHTVDSQSDLSVASFPNGKFIVAWNSNNQDGPGWGIYAQRFDANVFKVKAVGDEFKVHSHTTGDQTYPSIIPFSNGKFVICWTENDRDGSGRGVYAQKFDSEAGRIGEEFLVNNHTIGNQDAASGIALNERKFIITWRSQSQDGSGLGVYAKMYDFDGKIIKDEFRINTHTHNDQDVPSVTSLTNGNFVVTWGSNLQDGSDHGVYAKIFNGCGEELVPEFRVNTYKKGNQNFPDVSPLNNGGFVVTWTSYGQDGSADGVYAQRFDAKGNKVAQGHKIPVQEPNSREIKIGETCNSSSRPNSNFFALTATGLAVAINRMIN